MFYDFIYVCYTWRYAMPVLIKVCLGRQGHRCHNMLQRQSRLFQKKSNYNMLHVHDRQLAFVFFLCGKRI